MTATKAFPCTVCGSDMGWDRPSGVCSEPCLFQGQQVCVATAEKYRTFTISEVFEASITTGNVPRSLYRPHVITVNGVQFHTHDWEPVKFKAYAGGFNPVYGETVEAVKARIDARTRGMNDDGSYPEDDEVEAEYPWEPDYDDGPAAYDQSY